MDEQLALMPTTYQVLTPHLERACYEQTRTLVPGVALIWLTG